MKRGVLFFTLLCFFIFIFPVAAAIIEEDWFNDSHLDNSSNDGSGNSVTLTPVRKSYTSSDGKYTVTAKDFDAQGMIVIEITYQGRKENVIFQAEWNANMTYTILTPPVELFNKTMIITPKKIVPPAGIFSCCPEAEIHINVLRPELSIDFSSETSEYMINERIPVEIDIKNDGDLETHDNVVFIDVGGLKIESGSNYHQLPSLSGKDQKNYAGTSSFKINMVLGFPYPPKELNYSIHAYVKGNKNGLTYFDEASLGITILPSVKIHKSATSEIMLPSRKDIEKIYPNIDVYDIYRWNESTEAYVSIGVTNYQNYGIKGLKLTDSAGRQFNVGNQTLNWTFDLKPYEVRDFSYRVKSLRPGTLKHPAAQLTYSDMNQTWILNSDAPSTEVHGPCIQVFKKPDNPVIPPGSNVTITVTIRNSGDMPSRVNISDKVPENTTFINGRLNYEGALAPKDSVIISYNISVASEGQIQLPAPKMLINSKEDTGCGEPILGKIMVKEPTTPTPVKTIKVPDEKPPVNLTTPSPQSQQYRFLEGLIPALMLILAVTVLIILHRTTK